MFFLFINQINRKETPNTIPGSNILNPININSSKIRGIPHIAPMINQNIAPIRFFRKLKNIPIQITGIATIVRIAYGIILNPINQIERYTKNAVPESPIKIIKIRAMMRKTRDGFVFELLMVKKKWRIPYMSSN